MRLRRLASLVWILGVVAAGWVAPARAQYHFCTDQNADVVCACPGAPDLFCRGCTNFGYCSNCLCRPGCCSPGTPDVDGTFQCCMTGLQCYNGGYCPGDDTPCTEGQPCHAPNALCQEGICRRTPNSPVFNQATFTYTGRASTYCDVSGSTCENDRDPHDHCQVGDKALVDDPINPAARTSRNDVTEFSIAGSISPFALKRSYVSSEKTWAYQENLGSLTDPFLPKPFGSAANWPASLRWWHGLYSFVHPRGWVPGTSTWRLQEGDGTITDFVACSDGTSSCTRCRARRPPR